MSPGLSCNLEILFTPKIETYIVSSLPLLSETGPVSIPIICTYPKVVPNILTPEIVFEDVVMGETSTLYIKLKNDGALKTTYQIIDAATALSSKVRDSSSFTSAGQPTTEREEGQDSGEELQREKADSENALMDRVARGQLEWMEVSAFTWSILCFKGRLVLTTYSTLPSRPNRGQKKEIYCASKSKASLVLIQKCCTPSPLHL